MFKKTIFREQWLSDKDFSVWLCRVEGNENKASCRLCKKEFELSNMGKRSLISHQKGANHLSYANATKCQKINSFFNASSSLPSCSSSIQEKAENSNTVDSQNINNAQNSQLLTNYTFNKADAIAAEIRWCLNIVSTRASLNSSVDIADIFRLMFPDSKIAENFKLGRTKSSYVINHGISPYFHDKLLEKVNQCEDFVICFDEALNKIAQKGQMDLVVRFFDDSKGLVCSRYLESEFMGFSKSDDIFKHFDNGIRFLNKQKLLQVSMDGPNVNLSFLKKLKEHRKTTNPDGMQLLECGVCGLHVVHGAMKTGLAKVSWDLHIFLRHLYYVFKDSPARRSLFTANTECTEFPFKYCGIRWLENKKCLDRCLNIFSELKKFFSLKNVELPKTKPIQNVKCFFQDELLDCKLAFFYTITSDCEPFLAKFQGEKPLIYYLYEDLLVMLQNLLQRVVKKKVMSECSQGSQLLSLDLSCESNLLDPKNVDIGFKANKIINLKKIKGFTSEKDILKFKLDCRNIIVTLVSKIEERSPLKYAIVANISSLNPRNILQNNNLYIKRFQKLLQNLYDANRISDECAESAKIQYSNACADAKTILHDEFKEFVLNESTRRVDAFYFHLFGNKENYKDLWTVIKKVSILSHGNASVESGFSINKTLLVENLLEESLVAQRRVLDGIKEAGGVTQVEITPSLVSNVKASHSRYTRHLEEKNKLQSKENVDKNLKRKREEEIRKLEQEKKKLRIQAQAEEENINYKLSLLKK